MNVTEALRNFEFISLQPSCDLVIMVAGWSSSPLGVFHFSVVTVTWANSNWHPIATTEVWRVNDSEWHMKVKDECVLLYFNIVAMCCRNQFILGVRFGYSWCLYCVVLFMVIIVTFVTEYTNFIIIQAPVCTFTLHCILLPRHCSLQTQ
jgi:hypothetical protein